MDKEENSEVFNAYFLIQSLQKVQLSDDKYN